MTNDLKLNKTVSAPKKAEPKKKKRAASLDKRKARAGWWFVMPFIIGFIAVYLPVVFDSIRYSFSHIKIVSGEGFIIENVGWANYNEALFVNPDFVQTLLKGLQQLAFDIPAIILFSLFMAVLLNQKMAGRALFRAIFFIPVILSTGIMESINAQNIVASDVDDIATGTGQDTAQQIVSAIDIERLFAHMRVGQELVEYVVGVINKIYDIVNRAGVQMLIFLAGLQSISPAIYESCQIDGATAWETFWKITFPMISPMILVNSIYTVIDSFTTDSNLVMKFIASEYTSSNGQEISSAMAWMYFMIVIVAVGLIAAVCSAFVFYQKKD
ncbi:MAG: sugar ABC transporter permease [Clostridia bacterium]|nr:sugar ABC transporter permease [Clostridia bacterium]